MEEEKTSKKKEWEGKWIKKEVNTMLFYLKQKERERGWFYIAKCSKRGTRKWL